MSEVKYGEMGPFKHKEKEEMKCYYTNNEILEVIINGKPAKEYEQVKTYTSVEDLLKLEQVDIAEELMAEVTLTTTSIEELTKMLQIFHDYLVTFTRKHPEVNYSMKASRLNPEDDTKHYLKITISK